MGNPEPTTASARQLSDLMDFVAFTNEFRAIERTIWFKGVRGKERNGEHCFQIALCAWYANHRLNLGLNSERLIRYSLIHDLVEVYAKETPAFPDPNARIRAPVRATKKRREREAFVLIAREWATFPELVESIRTYEKKYDREALFICAFEKLVATINIYQDGGRSFRNLELNFKRYDRYKTARTNGHPVVKRLWDEMRQLLRKNEKDLFPSKPAA